MSNEELAVLIQNGHNEYMESLYIQNLRFICRIISQCGIDYKSNHEDYEDAKQNAYFGLAAAVNSFEVKKAINFSHMPKSILKTVSGVVY